MQSGEESLYEPWSAVPLVLIAGLFVAGLAVGGATLWAALELNAAEHEVAASASRPPATEPTARAAPGPAPGRPSAAPATLSGAAGALGVPVEPRASSRDMSSDIAPALPPGDAVDIAALLPGRFDPPTPVVAPSAPTAPSDVPSASGGECAPETVVRFDRNSSIPTSSATGTEVAVVADWLDRHPEARVLLEGHADASGAADDNLVLSFRRATAVKVELLRRGLRRDRIEVVALGDNRPVPGRAARDPANRRVVLRIVGHETCEAADVRGAMR